MVFQYNTVILLNLSFKLFSGVGLERLFTEEKNQDNERRRIDICGNGELININKMHFKSKMYILDIIYLKFCLPPKPEKSCTDQNNLTTKIKRTRENIERKLYLAQFIHNCLPFSLKHLI